MKGSLRALASTQVCVRLDLFQPSFLKHNMASLCRACKMDAFAIERSHRRIA
jgi:hypothetical protein